MAEGDGMNDPTTIDPLDAVREVQMMADLLIAQQRRDLIRAAVIRHARRVDRARAVLAGAEGQVVITSRARADAHHAVGNAMLRAVGADKACAQARLRVMEAVLALRAVEAEEVTPADIPA